MYQVVQRLRGGSPSASLIPEPVARRGEILISNAASVVSAGTEKSAIELARKSLLGKAIERPDHVRRVLEKLRSEGLLSTARQVLARLDDSIALGYSSAGVVLALGPGVQSFRPGDRVASNGPHAGVVAVPMNLCTLVPESVPFDQAAYTVLASIALNAVRLARTGLGDTALVIGLGLVGQIAVALLKAAGTRVFGMDTDPWKCETALRMGAEVARTDLSAETVSRLTRDVGADAVLIAASTPSDDPVALAAESVRHKGRIVAVGAVGMNLPRRPLYFKEAEFVVSCSYGPGRYDPEYEERGRDYPVGHVRWTEQRNMRAVVDLMAAGKLDLSPLTTHRFPIQEAGNLYGMIDRNEEKYLGVVIEYSTKLPASLAPPRQVVTVSDGKTGVGLLGAGQFAKGVLIPLLRKSGSFHPRVICTASGISAAQSADRFGFDVATTDETVVLADPAVKAVFILTRHDLHAGQANKALRAGKHVYCEKPLALTVEELDTVAQAVGESPGILMVGFNRRFSPAAGAVRSFFADAAAPLTISIRMNPGAVAANHWTQDEECGGGRIVGEACHAIDLATFLAGSLPVRVYADSVGGPQAPKITDDQSFITVRHANGSLSSIAYLAGGDRALGKERVEVLGGGRMAVIDDFREVTTAERGRTRRRRSWSQDKGHHGEIEAFADAITKGGAAPISWEEIRAVSLASILAVRSIREGMPFDIP